MFGRKRDHEPNGVDLMASMPDPCDPHNHIIFMNKMLMGVVACLGGCLVLGALLFFLLAAKPIPTIAVNHSTLDPPQVFSGANAMSFVEADARIFFINMLRLRYGSSSTALARDVKTLMGFTGGIQRVADSRYWSEVIEMPDAPHIKKTRLEAWADWGMQQHLILPNNLNAIECQCDPAAATWQCAVRVKQVTEFLGGSSQELEFTVLATMEEGARTIANPYGMLLTHLLVSEQPLERSKT